MRTRVVASAALVACAALGLAGCNFITPQATLEHYDPSDGVSAEIGDLHVLNALVLTEDGESGNLVMTVLNSGDDDAELTVQYETDGEKTTLTLDAPVGSTDFGGFGESEQVFLENIGTDAGGLLAIYFQYGDVQGKQVLIPVLDGSLAQYSPYLPQTPTPEPVETETAAPEPTETPEG
ncbi:MAG: DNA modification methylase [Microbacteriaceae bacterium]|nr:DNA modification methylase [Microbacteriaceae bacterium]